MSSIGVLVRWSGQMRKVHFNYTHVFLHRTTYISSILPGPTASRTSGVTNQGLDARCKVRVGTLTKEEGNKQTAVLICPTFTSPEKY